MPRPETTDGLDFYLMQARLRALTEDKEADAIAWFRDRLEQPGTPAQGLAQQYGLAIALQRQRELDEAREWLERLLTRDPDRLAYRLQLADLDLESGREAEALAALEELHLGFPGNHAIAVQYGEALLRSREPASAAKAARILRQQLLDRGDDPWLHELAARAASIAGDDVRASEELAESYFHSGSVKEAIEQLEMLSDREDLDYYQRARVTARLEEMRIVLQDFDVAEPEDEAPG